MILKKNNFEKTDIWNNMCNYMSAQEKITLKRYRNAVSLF